jgi:TRAP-type transport system periplasmic protein
VGTGALHLYEVGDLPIGSPDAWVAMRAIYEVATENEAVIEEFAEHDATYLLQFNTGPVQLICREPIETVEDFQGRRIRAVGPYIEAFQALGAEIVSFPQIEVYQALDSGLVDCNQVYWSNVTAYRLHEVADYLVELDYGQMLGLVGVINKPLWDGLSAEHQALMREVGSETVDFLARKLLELEDEVKANLTGGIDGHTVEIRQVPDDVMQVVLDEGSGLADVWLEAVQAKGLAGEAVLGQFMEAQERYAEELEQTAIRGSDAATSRQRWTIAPSPATGRTGEPRRPVAAWRRDRGAARLDAGDRARRRAGRPVGKRSDVPWAFDPRRRRADREPDARDRRIAARLRGGAPGPYRGRGLHQLAPRTRHRRPQYLRQPDRADHLRADRLGAWNVLGRDIETGRFYEGLLRVPAWPAKAFFFFGLTLFSLRLLLNLFEDVQRLFGRRPIDPGRAEG